MFGAHPEHIWLIYLVEGYYMIPRKFYNMWNAKPMNQALYYLDFCVSIVVRCCACTYVTSTY